jgi:chemotaxis protein MotB
VVSVLIARYNFDPARISVAGYAQYRPLASNVTESGRSKNRRIDLVVLSGPADESDMAPKSFGSGNKP